MRKASSSGIPLRANGAVNAGGPFCQRPSLKCFGLFFTHTCARKCSKLSRTPAMDDLDPLISQIHAVFFADRYCDS